MFHGEAVFLEKGYSGGDVTCVPWRGSPFGKGLFGGDATCVPWRGSLFGKGLFGGGALLVFHGEAVFLEKGCSGGGGRYLCSFWKRAVQGGRYMCS